MSLTLSPALRALLDAGAAFDAEYGRALSSHRSMALLALERLGAPAARLEQFEAAYARRLRPAPPPVRWPSGDAWFSRLGDARAWSRHRDLFGPWLAHEAAGEVLEQTLPRLMRGCGGAAFHGLIRTAYAVQAQHHQELTDALAHWACVWLDLGDAPAGPVTDPEAVLRHLPVVHSEAGLIAERLAVAAADPRFQAAAARLGPQEGTLSRLAVLAAEAYAASGNFTALHLVTSAHALRVLMPHLAEPVPAIALYARAFNAAVCVARLAVAPPVPLLPWAQIVERAIASDDDHVIKLVDSAREQQAALGGAVWRRAASRAVA